VPQESDKGIGVVGGPHFLQVNAKDQLHALKGSAEESRKVILVTSDGMI
jgi:hypothetical protein